MEHAVPTEVLALLAAAVLAVALFRRLRLPPVLGYLLAGVVGGPHALAWFGAGNDEALQLLGELGVAFLLFAIGLEFSIPQFWAMRRTLVGLGGAQVLAGTLSGGLIAWWLGVPAAAAVIVGGALAMSSTAIVVRQLTEQLELQDAHGRLALGVLLFQDLAAVPFLVVIPILAAGPVQSQALAGALLIALAKAAAALTVLLLLGRWALRPLFHQIAAARSAELFTLTVLLVALLAAWLTDRLGLSLALGAFLSGMMLGETEYRHQIEADIRPFRDLLLGLFFITIGMRLDPAALPALWAWVALLVIGLVAGKGLLIAALAAAGNLADRNHRSQAMRTGLVLAHGGEFGLALLALALNTGLLVEAEVQPVLAAVIVSMLLAPLLIRYNGQLASGTPQRLDAAGETAAEIAAETRGLSGHVIICGYGRVGQAVAAGLREVGREWVALDLDPQRVKIAWEDGAKVFYGDAGRRDLLAAVGLDRAEAMVISFNDLSSALSTLHQARTLYPAVPVLARAVNDVQQQQLLGAGAADAVADSAVASRDLLARLAR